MKKLLILLILPIFCTSCATFAKNSKITINAVNSKTKHKISEVYLYENDKIICELPCSKKLKRWQDEYSFTLKHKDYLDKKVTLTAFTNAVFVFDCIYLVAPPIGLTFLGIDASTNSFRTYSREYNIAMDINREIPSEINKKVDIEDFIKRNFDDLRMEAYHNDLSKNITTLAKMTNLKKETLQNIIFRNLSADNIYKEIIDRVEIKIGKGTKID